VLAKPEIVVGAFDVGFAGFELLVTFPTLGLTLPVGIDGVVVLLWEDVGIEGADGRKLEGACEGIDDVTFTCDEFKVEGACDEEEFGVATLEGACDGINELRLTELGRWVEVGGLEIEGTSDGIVEVKLTWLGCSVKFDCPTREGACDGDVKLKLTRLGCCELDGVCDGTSELTFGRVGR
jgi:hypothetical protein